MPRLLGRLSRSGYKVRSRYTISALLLALLAGFSTLDTRPGSAQTAVPDASVPQGEPGNAPVVSGLRPEFGNGLIISGATRHRLLHFTFDDGPDLKNTPLLLDKLDKAGVKATFFFSGIRFRKNRLHNARAAELAREVLRRGHSIGSHSVDHQRMFPMSAEQIKKQLDETEQLFIRVLGARPWLFRPPWGSHSATVDRLLAERGYTEVLWNNCAADWVERPVKKMLLTWKQVMAKIEQTKGQRGGVILLHDRHPWSIELFELIHAEILARNCRLLQSGEELYDITDDLGLFYAPRGDSGASRRAPEAEPEPAVLEARQARLRKLTAERCGQATSSGPEVSSGSM